MFQIWGSVRSPVAIRPLRGGQSEASEPLCWEERDPSDDNVYEDEPPSVEYWNNDPDFPLDKKEVIRFDCSVALLQPAPHRIASESGLLRISLGFAMIRTWKFRPVSMTIRTTKGLGHTTMTTG